MNNLPSSQAIPSASATHYTAVPDLILLVSSIVFFQVLEVFHRNFIGRLFSSYNSLPFRDRFEWDRRALNCTFQLLQTVFNLYILLLDQNVSRDYIYGYSPLAHTAFIIIIAFYIHDSAGFVMHPSPPSLTSAWLTHHVLAVGLLAYDVAYRQCSAFPAAAFLISAAGHIPNDLRWWSAAMNVRNQFVLKTTHFLCVFTVFVTCALPPLYLLYKCAQQLNVTIAHLFLSHMRFYCRFFFLLIYVPHMALIVAQVLRAYYEWGTIPKPFRVTKVD